VRYIAPEEAFAIPGLAEPMPQLSSLTSSGAPLPCQRSRLDSRYAVGPAVPALKRAPSAYIGTNIVITNGGVFSPGALTGAVLEVGADAVMFSVDYPYESCLQAVDGFERTTQSQRDREKIAHGNAQRILRI
jgi:2,3-dihydroxybenzoate decarboxylase